MKQVLQNLRTGETTLADVPAPPAVGGVLIRTRRSLISAGTERMLVEFSRGNLIQKARAQPDKVKQVLDKIRTDGLLPTLEAVFNRLDEPLPLGYCNAGVVLDTGTDPRNAGRFRKGDRVVSNGPHAEVVCVPRNLCCTIPDSVTDDEAAFTVLASIGLQGVRLTQPTLGERVVVVGLGLIGLTVVQLLVGSGCGVLGVDLAPDRLALAEQFGADTVNVGEGADPVTAASAWTDGRGADAVLIAASAKTDEIVRQAARMCRKRGRIVLVGVVGLNLRREDFYEKELTFQVSCSYGPGRYDEAYEQGGQDYPYGLVRWTEQRNFEAVLDMMAAGRLDVKPLISRRFPIDRAPDAYAALQQDRGALGVLLEYPDREAALSPRVQVTAAGPTSSASACVVGVIGAGNYSKMTLMPALAKTSARIKYVCDLNAPAARHAAQRHGAENAITNYGDVLSDPEVNLVLIAVGHSLHARLIRQTLAAGKHAFVEKPLAMNVGEIGSILAAYEAACARAPKTLMVGFNRRFSPHTKRIRKLLAGRSEPLAMACLVNAGAVPPDHWVHDPVRGGGRIVGEACHFIDLMAHIAGSRVRAVSAHMMGQGPPVREDKMTLALSFDDGSVGSVCYFANGSKAYPKERVQVFSEGRTLELDNFRRTRAYGFPGTRRFKTFRQDKGHAAEFAALTQFVADGGDPLIPVEDLVNVTLASFAAVQSAREDRTIVLNEEYGEALQRAKDASTSA